MAPLEKSWNPEVRKQIASQVIKARKSEKRNDREAYGFLKNGKEYIYRMGGLKHLFEYIRSLPTNRVLDIGTGNGNASRVVSQMPISVGLDFEVTALRNTTELQQNFPKNKVHITGVERLRGIANESLAGVLGVNSITYSDNPELAIKRLNEVLVPGGVVKATFCVFGKSEDYNGTVFKDPAKFIEAFLLLGYDVFLVKESISYSTNYVPPLKNSVILAVKPGNQNAPSAEELLLLDSDDIKSEAVEYYKGHPVFNTRDQ